MLPTTAPFGLDSRSRKPFGVMFNEAPDAFRSWGWHDRNAAAVKALIQQEVSQALAEQQAASERAALRSEELSKASARVLEKVKSSAARVAAERAAAEKRAKELHEKQKEQRRLDVQHFLEAQAAEEARNQALVDQVHALLQLDKKYQRNQPKPNPHHLRKVRYHAATAQARRRALRGWQLAMETRAETVRAAEEQAEEAAWEEEWIFEKAMDAEDLRWEAADRGRARIEAVAAKAAESNRQADERAHAWFLQAEAERKKKEMRLAKLLPRTEAAREMREENSVDWVDELSERVTDAAEAAEARRAEADDAARKERNAALKVLQAEQTKLIAQAQAANKRPPDNSYCSVDDYLSKLHAQHRRRTYDDWAWADRQNAHVESSDDEPEPEPEPEPIKPSRWIPAKNAILLGLELEQREQALRKMEGAFMVQRKTGTRRHGTFAAGSAPDA